MTTDTKFDIAFAIVFLLLNVILGTWLGYWGVNIMTFVTMAIASWLSGKAAARFNAKRRQNIS